VNPAEILTLRTAAGEQKVIWKPDKGSEPIKSLKIGAASLSQREQAAYEIDQAIHGSNGTVPPTVARKRDGIVGTMQMFAPDGARGGMSFEDELRKEPEKFAAAAQPVFLTDTITRNIDRHSGNILWSKVGDQYKPHAIDNGAAFGSGPSSPPFGFRWPVYDHRYIESSLRFSPETQATARAMDIEQLAAALAKQDKISRVQKIEALARAASLRKDPAQLTTFADRDEAAIRAIQDADLTDDEKQVNVMTAKLEEWLSRAPKKRNLTAEELAEIERLIP
jgi:hypothetical protein